MSSSSERLVLPVRLINLAETLAGLGRICFVEPRGWEFHVISHTWSQDVRNWSSKIGKLLRSRRSCCGRRPSGGHSYSYSELFETQDFSKEKGYDFFAEFLRVLRAEGVENVWFDALCINQEDVEEKSREIKHMGAYYSHSLGCYVWTHGVGQGFSLWSWREGRASLPRWFSRVWTFQELLLPNNLIFLVELQYQERQLLINRGTCFKAYSLMNHEMTYCCSEDVSHVVVDNRSGNEDACLRAAGNYENSPVSLPFLPVDADNLVNAVFVCAKCCSKVASSRQVSWSPMCLVERAAYLDVMMRAGKGLIGREDEQTLLRLDFLVRQIHGELDDVAIFRMHGLLEQPQLSENIGRVGKVLEPQVVLGEIGERHCSAGHDEDRVLSIVGLLGVEEIAPVRAGKSLGEQIVELAKALLQTGNQQLLLKLCSAPFMSDYETAPGMSWVPPFKVPTYLHQYRESFSEASTSPSYQPIAQVQHVSPVGLTLFCHIMKAKIFPFSSHQCSPPMFRLSLISNPNTTYPLLSCFTSPHQLSLTPHETAIDLIGDLLLQAKAMKSIHRSSTFLVHVWLLLLASIESEVNVFMACVGNCANKLHKVGIIITPQDSSINLSGMERTSCTIGGFGKYLPINLLMM